MIPIQHLSFQEAVSQARPFLSKPSNGSWLGRKVYLGYCNETGWKIYQLGFFSRVLRRLNLAYRDTHFQHVVAQLDHLTKEEALSITKSGLMAKVSHSMVTKLAEIFDRHNKLNGPGKKTFGGETFDGVFKDDQLIEGTITKSGGSVVLKGKFQNGLLIEGKKTKYGTTYEGKFENDKLIEGKKTEYGTTYEGKFENDKLIEGKISGNGIIREGKFKDEKLIEGQQTFEKTGSIYKGKFDKVEHLVGQGRWKTQDFEQEGIFHDGRLIEGTMIFKDRTMLKGKFGEGAYFEGTKTLPSGEKWIGQFNYGELDGKGSKILVDGTIVQGEFKAGKLVNGRIDLKS